MTMPIDSRRRGSMGGVTTGVTSTGARRASPVEARREAAGLGQIAGEVASGAVADDVRRRQGASGASFPKIGLGLLFVVLAFSTLHRRL
jgi:hypothetical protein